MKMKCLACGATKETSAKEVYPYSDDGIVSDEPIEPLFVIECQGPLLRVIRESERVIQTESEWRVVIVCHECLHRLSPDMWISDSGWASLNPVTPFEQLPRPLADDHSGDRFEVEAYVPRL